MKLIHIIFLSLVFIFVGCKIGKRYEAPEIKMPDTYQSNISDTSNIANLKWWDVYNDSILVKYINQALENNQDLKIAISRVEEYRSLRRISESDLLPSIKVSGEREHEVSSGNISETDNELVAELNWELDLWGRLRWQREAGIADYRATEEDKNAVFQSLIANVGTTYFELMAAKRELAIIEQTAESREEGVKIAELRYKGGLTSETPLQQAQVELAKTLTLIPEIKYTIRKKNNLLSTLMGQFPEKELLSTLLLEHKLPDSVPVGIPSDLLTRRPDIRKAEQDVISANAKVGMALTNMFPKISLSAEYGYESEALSDLFSSPYNYLYGQLLSPIFNAGANRARHKAAKAVLDQKALTYDKVVLKSFEETSNALGNVTRAKSVRNSLIKLEESSRTYLKLANLQHINGVVSYIDVLDAQRLLFDAEIRLNNAIRDEKIAYVQLYKALGGGW
nr:TolC family protein [uncultured Carboxylicivirga sp.]